MIAARTIAQQLVRLPSLQPQANWREPERGLFNCSDTSNLPLEFNGVPRFLVKSQDEVTDVKTIRYSILAEQRSDAEAIFLDNASSGFHRDFISDELYASPNFVVPDATIKNELSLTISNYGRRLAANPSTKISPKLCDLLLGIPDQRMRQELLVQLNELDRLGKYDDFLVDLNNGTDEFVNFFRGPADERVGAWEVLQSSSDDAIRALKTNTDWLTDISRWIDEGIDVISLNGSVRLRNSTAELGRVDASGRLFPTYFDQNWYPFTGYTVIGSPQNGCQIYKSPSGGFIVKREPDLTGHDPAYVNTYLTGSKKCHALERHNFDVSDEALQYRAQFGVAPDGSKTGWNYTQNADGTWANISTPPYSSKFSSAQRMQDAIDATKPPVGHTGAWNPPKYNDPNGIPFGYGYPRANSAGVVPPPIDLTAVKVIWLNEGGNWKVLTMYPDTP